MSAFLCSPAHFDALADFAVRAKVSLEVPRQAAALLQASEVFAPYAMAVHLDRENPALVAALLRDENVKTMRHNYGDRADECDVPYAYRPVARPLSPEGAENAARCYDYQMDHPSWAASLACAIIVAIRDKARLLRELEVPTSDVFANAVTPEFAVEESHVRPSAAKPTE